MMWRSLSASQLAKQLEIPENPYRPPCGLHKAATSAMQFE